MAENSKCEAGVKTEISRRHLRLQYRGHPEGGDIAWQDAALMSGGYGSDATQSTEAHCCHRYNVKSIT